MKTKVKSPEAPKSPKRKPSRRKNKKMMAGGTAKGGSTSKVIAKIS